MKILDELEGTPELEDELPLFNKVGDLYVKKKDTNAAIEMFEKAAQHYESGGFPNNAIALYNKILRNAPSRMEIYLKLGVLMVERGFAAEAKKNFVEFIERMGKDGKEDEAFREIKKYADRSENSEDVRLILAEQLKEAARTDEAREQLAALHAEMEAGQTDGRRSRSTIQRMKAIDPDFDPESAPDRKLAKKQAQSDIVFIDLDSGDAEVLEPIEETPPEGPTAEPTAVEDVAAEVEQEVVTDEELAQAAARESTALEGLDTVESFEAPEQPVGGADIEVESFGEEELITQSFEDQPGELGVVELDTADVGDLPEVPDNASGEIVLETEPEPVTFEPEEELSLEPVEEITLGGDDDLTLEVGEEVTLEVGDDYAAELEIEQPPTLEELAAAVSDDPANADARHKYAEALIESGDLARGLGELDAAAGGYADGGDLASAVKLLDEALRLERNDTARHRSRVEYLSKLGDNERLVQGYLAYADALLASGDMDGARTAYLNVLEHDAQNEQAKTALETVVPEEPVAAPAAADGGDFVNLGELIFGDEDIEMDTRMKTDAGDPTGDEDADFKDMLDEFKKGISANIAEEDADAHYDLGVAFKEMGLVDEAIGEFQKALRGKDSKLKAAEALGTCFFEKGQFPVAATVLKRAVDSDTSPEEQKIGLLYWLGRCEEEQEHNQAAVEYYQRVFALDIAFQDVKERVSNLT